MTHRDTKSSSGLKSKFKSFTHLSTHKNREGWVWMFNLNQAKISLVKCPHMAGRGGTDSLFFLAPHTLKPAKKKAPVLRLIIKKILWDFHHLKIIWESEKLASLPGSPFSPAPFTWMTDSLGGFSGQPFPPQGPRRPQTEPASQHSPWSLHPLGVKL